MTVTILNGANGLLLQENHQMSFHPKVSNQQIIIDPKKKIIQFNEQKRKHSVKHFVISSIISHKVGKKTIINKTYRQKVMMT